MVTFCDDNKYVQLTMCEVDVTVQELVNAIRTYEAGLCFLDDAKITDATGKEAIGGGASTAITLTLQNCWRIRGHCGFACQTNVVISQGNIAFTGCPLSPPLVAVANVTYIIGNSTAPGLSGTIAADMTKVRRYLTNKKNITGTTLTVLCDDNMCVPTQTYSLDDGDDPKSQTPV